MDMASNIFNFTFTFTAGRRISCNVLVHMRFVTPCLGGRRVSASMSSLAECRVQILKEVAMMAVTQQFVPEPYSHFFKAEDAIIYGPLRALEFCRDRYGSSAMAADASSQRRGWFRILKNPTQTSKQACELNCEHVMVEAALHAEVLLRAPQNFGDSEPFLGLPSWLLEHMIRSAVSRKVAYMLDCSPDKLPQTCQGMAGLPDAALCFPGRVQWPGRTPSMHSLRTPI